MSRKRALAIQFGNIIMIRARCNSCGGECFIVKGHVSSCCRSSVTYLNKKGLHKETDEIGMHRKIPSKKSQEEILSKQHDCCYWCGKELGTYIISRSGNTQKLRIEWDHYIPFRYTGISDDKEFVAACHKCNRWKSGSMIMVTDREHAEEILRNRIMAKWEASGWGIV